MRKPAGVLVITGFLWFATAVSLLVGFTLLFPDTPLEEMWQLNRPALEAFQAIGWAAGGGFVFLAFVAASAAIGFARGDRWAWWIAVVALCANIAGDVINLVVRRELLRYGSGVVIATTLLVLLFRAPVRKFFLESAEKT